MVLAATHYTRRGVLLLGAATAASGILKWVAPQREVLDPNDFPVASYLPPGGPIDVANWRLAVNGAVANPLSLSYSDLLSLRRERHRYEMKCVTNWATTQDWEGIPLSVLIERARPILRGTGLRVTSADGHWVALQPYRYENPATMVVTHVSGVPLTDDHGFPARLMTPDIDGVSNAKWLVEIQVQEV